MRPFPQYPRRPHKTGQARIVIAGRHVYLGKFGSEQSLVEYRRVLAEWQAHQSRGPIVHEPDTITLLELAARFKDWAAGYYRDKDGRPTLEIDSYRLSLLPLLTLYGTIRVAKFGPLELRAVRAAMITGSWMSSDQQAARAKGGKQLGLSRKVVNQRVNRIKRLFRWGLSYDLVPPDVERRVCSVAALPAGRSEARDYPDVLPVPVPIVAKTLLHLGPVVSAMVRIQTLTGMRPGEVCRLIPAEVDRVGLVVDDVRVWVYRPSTHKTAWLGHTKVGVFGPKAQAILAPFLDRPADTPLFSPAEEVLAVRGVLPRGDRTPGDRYTTAAYGKRIRAVCDSNQIPRWTPHRLRHLAETEYESAFGLDTARAVLGHRDAQMTIRYGQQDLEKAARAAAKIG